MRPPRRAHCDRRSRRPPPRPVLLPRAASRAAVRAASSRRRAQPVTDTTHREDELRTELAPQTMDVYLDCIAFDFLTPAVQTLLELSAREDRPGALHQQLQQRELAWRERH